MTERSTAQYLDRLLRLYSDTFNIYKPYRIGAKEYPAYGYFFSHNEKYVLVREANMWTTDAYEHILFMEVEECTQDVLQEAENLIRDYMEPELVRKGEALPAANHMYSYINVVIICRNSIEKALQKRMKKFCFEKGYQFNLRGFSRGIIMGVSLADRAFYSNYHGREQKKLFLQVFSDVEAGKQGFEQALKESGKTPFRQEGI